MSLCVSGQNQNLTSKNLPFCVRTRTWSVRVTHSWPTRSVYNNTVKRQLDRVGPPPCSHRKVVAPFSRFSVRNVKVVGFTCQKHLVTGVVSTSDSSNPRPHPKVVSSPFPPSRSRSLSVRQANSVRRRRRWSFSPLIPCGASRGVEIFVLLFMIGHRFSRVRVLTVRWWCWCHRGSPSSLTLASLVFCSDVDGELVEVAFRLWTPCLGVCVQRFDVVFWWRRHQPFVSRL
jgi:hypothetical protein